jgi:hypothetical protein
MAQNGFVIGINTSENRTTLNGLTMTSPMKPNATNNYSSIYGVLVMMVLTSLEAITQMFGCRLTTLNHILN